MFRLIKKLFKDAGIYAGGVALQALLGFLLVPLYTRFLSEADYGRLEILQTFLKILLFILPLGFASALQKCYHRDTKSRQEKKELLGTALWFILPLGILELVVLSFFAWPLSRLLLGFPYPLLFYFLLATSFFAVLTELILSQLRAQERSKRYTVIFLFRFLVTLAATLFAVIFLKLGLVGVILANLLGQGLSSLFALPEALKYVRIRPSKRALTKLLLFGLPILPASIAMWVMDLSDRYFLRFFQDFTGVGLYSLGYRVGFLLEFVLIIPFQLAWPAFSFRIAKQKGHQAVYARVFTYFCLLGAFGVLGLSLFAPEVISILAPSSYAAAARIVPLVSLAYVFYGMHFVLAPGIHLRGKTHYYPWLIVGPALLNIGLNFYFVPRYGMLGAALTTTFSFFVVAVSTYLVSQHLYPLRLEWRRLAKISVIGIAIYSFWALQSFLTSQIILKIALLVFYWLGLWALHFFTPAEAKQIKAIFKRQIS